MSPIIFRCSRCSRIFPESSFPPVCCGTPAAEIPDLYSLLGCTKNCPDRILDRQFRTLAMRWHPDRCSDKDARKIFITVADAYQLLRDPQKRSLYDRTLNSGLSPETVPEAVRQTSRAWSEDSFSAFYERMVRVSEVFRRISDTGRSFFSLPGWNSKKSAQRGRVALAGYALNGFWFLVGGAFLFPFLVVRSLQKKPEREETFLTLLGVLQLVPLLAYLIIMERIPLFLHLIFWGIWGSATLFLLIWKRLFRIREHPLCRESPDVPR